LKTRSFAEIGDASWLLTLVEECLDCRHAYDRQDLLDVIKRNDSLSITAWEGDQPAGFLIGKIHPERGRPEDGPVFYVEEIGVRPAFRRQGFATRLLAEGFARARARGRREARLHVVGDNQAGLGLYHKLGFEEVRRVGWWKLS
jgi:ribosomal protein S18 acetylase RimI-like enzyme